MATLIESLYYVKHADGTFSVAEPQPSAMTTAAECALLPQEGGVVDNPQFVTRLEVHALLEARDLRLRRLLRESGLT